MFYSCSPHVLLFSSLSLPPSPSRDPDPPSWTSTRLKMKAADEPPYLSVGTDVSAKYRGAFCEAKIKTVKRMVKVKVNLKGESTFQVVQDDQVKGTLRVGSTVEVKTNEGLSSEAVISKLTDASLYTVVFDDGDEKTLRRTSLCLKGERHFAESETLDQLPLTNPEHFGTPVIGKKSNRGGRRSSQAVADEEHESSSSDDEEDDRRRLNDELLGKICSVESEEESSSWYLALVVSPSCNDELVVKKDQCLVRAFSDSKFYTVARRHVHTFSSIGSTRSEFSSRKGFEAAQVFLRTAEVPDSWKMDMSQILDSSSSDDEDDEQKESDEDEEDEDDKKKKKRIKEEPEEEEPDPEERDGFLQQLYKFMEDRGTPINKPPVLGYKDLNLFKLFRLVYHLGGCHKIESGTVWKQVYMDLGIPVLNSAASYNVKTAYKKYLYGFEEYCRSASITFRTIHHNNPRPPTTPTNQKQAGTELNKPSTPPEEEKEEPVQDKMEEAESESESEKEEVKEPQSSPRGRRRCVGSQLKAERESPSGLEKGGGGGADNSEEQREVRRRSNRRMDDSEKGSEEEEEEDDEEDEEDEEEMERRREGCEDEEDEEDGDSVTGTKVRVKYGRGKTQKIYEAHIKKTDVDNGEQFYLVHYYGWNVRYDEWVKADRLIWPVEKGTKKRRRKKVKNKDEPETERDKDEEKSQSAAVKPPGAKRGRPQIRTTPTGSAGRSVSKTPSSEGRSNGRRTETPSNMANGDNTPRRRTRRTSGLYDSDRASNEDSGNSSEDSESEDPPDKKPSPWRGRTEGPPCQEEEVKEEETSEVADITTAANEDTVTVATAGQLSVATGPQRPSMPQEKTEKLLSQSETEEAEQGEEPTVEAAMLLINLDKETTSVQERDNFPAQEVLAKTSPPPHGNKMSPPPHGNKTSPPPHGNKMSPPPPHGNKEDSRSTSLSSPRVKGRRALLREMSSETPPRIPLCPSPANMVSPSRSVLKRQDEPMVVLHCLPTQRLPPESPTADSDTDSATEEEEEGEEIPEKRSSSTLKRKAAEQRAADKKLRPERRQEESVSPKTTPASSKMAAGASPKALPSPLCRAESERRSEGVMKAEDWPHQEDTPREASEELLTGGAMTESEVHAGMPAPEAPGPSPAEELEPQIGPEALVCHEVDLDDPDEKEKPSTAPEHLLLMMREQQPAPPPHPNLLHASLPSPNTPHLPQPHLRPFLPAAAPGSASCPEELHPARSAGEEERGAARREQEGDSSPGFDGSASSSTSLLSLQETKDRGQKRVMDCNTSPTAKKQKRNQKRLHTPGKVEKNGAGHSSDSEDQSRLCLSQKSQKSRCVSSPSSHSKDKHTFSPQRTYKWTLQLDELDSMSSSERISFLQDKLQEIRKYYMTLKSEVASIDRRRKRLKKKEREVSNMTASTSSGSSDTGMSPSSASPTQNTVAVECR
ncbi:AT-rich interactive domain-containing protein 4A [Anoplopoma fimbria]|uniref:AT-rich interactive domain-containing protein 4A n=1 Tax=Anoplopoma fimbria TaxID=229290 RepID=UPI0023EBF944|nr:AT-rich interactive domain-containing protein 4A [Anoplopoma fimbria]